MRMFTWHRSRCITDIAKYRLELAKQLFPGVKTVKMEVEKTAEKSAASGVVKVFGELEPRVARECTGVESSIVTLMHVVKFGGTVFIIGVGEDEVRIPLMRASTREVVDIGPPRFRSREYMIC